METYEKYLNEKSVEKHGVKAITGMEGPAHATPQHFIEISKNNQKAKIYFYNSDEMNKVWKVISKAVKDFSISSVSKA
jgi:hypothetical protein